MFYEGLRDEVVVPVDILNSMFPRLDILLHSHKTFLNNLTALQSQHKDKIIEEIGKFLIEQVSCYYIFYEKNSAIMLY